MDKLRWQLRIEHFEISLDLLEEAIALSAVRGLSELEKAGLIQRFEIAWEQGWKSMGEFLLATEIPDLVLTAGSVTRAAVVAGLIEDGEGWMLAGKLRNILSYEYSGAKRDDGIDLIERRFLPLMQNLRVAMAVRRGDA